MAQGVQRLCFAGPIPDHSSDPSSQDALALGKTKIGEYRLRFSCPWQNIIAGRRNYPHLAQEVNARDALQSRYGSGSAVPFASKGRDVVHCVPPREENALSILVAPRVRRARFVLQG